MLPPCAPTGFTHQLAVAALRHGREMAAVQATAAQREKAIRHEACWRDRALQEIACERDDLASQLAAMEGERAQLAARACALKQSRARHTHQLVGLRARAAAERGGTEVRSAAAQQRLEEVTARARSAERAETELRRELDEARLARQDVERTIVESREALQSAWRELGGASAAKEHMTTRASMLEAEMRKLDERARASASASHEREAELREACAALAAAREQRNQAARDAEACRAKAAEASDDVRRSAELAAASESRVAAAERKAVQELLGRQRAEARLEESVLADHAARARRQHRMLALLMRVTRVQCALGFSRWLAAAAAIDAEAARSVARREASSARDRAAEAADALVAFGSQSGVAARVAALGGVWLGGLDLWTTRRAAAAALTRWLMCVRSTERCVRRWGSLARAAELNSALLSKAGVGLPWRYKLLQRGSRLRAYYKRSFVRSRASYFDSGRVRRAVFALWRAWAQDQLSRDHGAIASARRLGLHVAGSARWWAERSEEKE